MPEMITEKELLLLQEETREQTPLRTFTREKKSHPFLSLLKRKIAIERQFWTEDLFPSFHPDPLTGVISPRDISGSKRLRGLTSQQAFEHADWYTYQPHAKQATVLSMLRRTTVSSKRPLGQMWGMIKRAGAQEDVARLHNLILDTQRRAVTALFSGNGELAAQLVMQLEPYDAALFSAVTKRNYLVRSFPPRFSPHPDPWSPYTWDNQARRNWFRESES